MNFLWIRDSSRAPLSEESDTHSAMAGIADDDAPHPDRRTLGIPALVALLYFTVCGPSEFLQNTIPVCSSDR